MESIELTRKSLPSHSPLLLLQEEWSCVPFTGRIDSFRQKEAIQDLLDRIQKSPTHLLLDLSKTEFLSLPFIRSLNEVIEKLAEQDKILALCGLTEKLKRQIFIYSGLEDLLIFRSKEDFDKQKSGQGW